MTCRRPSRVNEVARYAAAPEVILEQLSMRIIALHLDDDL